MYNFDKKEFANILKAEIKKAGYSQEKFAECCNISVQSLRDYLNPKKNTSPNTETLCTILNTLNISIDDLFNKNSTTVNKNIEAKDIINAINLLIEAYGNEVVTICRFKKCEVNFNEFPRTVEIDGYCLHIDDEKIQNYLQKIQTKGSIKNELAAVDALDKYYELLDRWADIEGCIFNNKRIYNPITHNLEFEEIIDDDDDLPF